MTKRTPRRVLVTGAQGSLGSQVARKFLETGAEVVAVDHRLSPSGRLSGVTWVEADLADPEAIKSKIPTDVDAMVHCAGGFRWSKLENLTNEDFEFLLNANLKSSFFLVRHLLPGMRNRGFGRLVLVGAQATLHPGVGMSAYAASKAGINMLVQSAAQEIKDCDITINAVLPSILDTPANRKDMPEADPSAWVPLSDLTDIIFSLTQPWGKVVHGALIPVSGRV